MAVASVVFADVSYLDVAGTEIVSCTGFQASRGAEQRPIYTWNKSKPHFIISTPGIGQGSFTYIAADTNGADQDWSTVLDGTKDITVAAGVYPGGARADISFSKCGFAGQSASMNTKSEMQVTVNFTFGKDSDI